MCRVAGADTCVVDSLKDAALGLSDDEVGAGWNRARQGALVDGVQLLELHHNTKRTPSGGKPDALPDVYGSVWLTAGAGSVVMLSGDPGDLTAKQAAAAIGETDKPTASAIQKARRELDALVRAGVLDSLPGERAAQRATVYVLATVAGELTS